MSERQQRFTVDAGVRALLETGGILSVAAKRLGVSRQALYKRIAKNDKLRHARDEAREIGGDVAEAALFRAIKRGEAWAIKWYLATQHKERGYIEKVTVEGSVRHSGTIAHDHRDIREKLEDRLKGMGERLHGMDQPIVPEGWASGNGDDPAE